MTASAAPAVKPFEHGIPSILWVDIAEGGDQTTKIRREQEGSYDDTAGSITALIYSPSHYGEVKSGSKPSFQLVVGHPFDLASLGSLYIPPRTS